MKKLFLSIISVIAVFLITQPLQAGVSKCDKGKLAVNDWTFFQIGFWFDVPSSISNSNVYGIKTGEPISTGIGRVMGLEASWFLSGTDNIDGLQVCWATCFNEKLNGIQASFGYNHSRDELYGLQAGSVNICGYLAGFQPGAFNMARELDGFQAGAVNISRKFNGFQAGVLVNATEELTGLQAGIVNAAKKLLGWQTGLINMAYENTGLQFGLLNLSKKDGVQIGLLNYIKGSKLPLMPFFNISF